MYVVPALNAPFVLKRRDGATWTYATLAEVLRSLRAPYWCVRLGAEYTPDRVKLHFDVDGRLLWREVVCHGVDHILVDSAGRVLSCEDLERLGRQANLLKPWVSRRARALQFYPGYGPVPGTAKRRGGHHMYRRPGTTPARRDAQVVDPLEPQVRARRRPANLLNAWDDEFISARRSRSWKRHRRTQWKS
jgi:hypothetical protein